MNDANVIDVKFYILEKIQSHSIIKNPVRMGSNIRDKHPLMNENIGK